MLKRKRDIGAMFSGAMAAQESETITLLKEEIESLKSASGQSLQLPIKDIQPLQLPNNLKQPRLYFDPVKMKRLKESIEKHGVLEPILVRPRGEGGYETISGERRWRSSCELKLEYIPGIVREMSDEVALEAALIAHLLNEEISTIEQTESILSLLSLHLGISIEEVKSGLYRVKNANTRGNENSRIFTEEELAAVTQTLSEFGMKLSSFVSNRLPMLNLAPIILDAVREGDLSPTNAVILNRQDSGLHQELVEQAKGLSKQDVIELVKEVEAEHPNSTKQSLPPSMPDRILAKFKSTRKRKELLESAEAQKRLRKIEKLLDEIEALNT